MLAAMPAAANRGRSAGSTSWRCSTRGMNGRRRGGRFQGVERGPDRGVTDGVDLRRDAAGGRPLDQLAERLGLGHPDATAPVRRERTIRLRLDVGEEGRRPRAERPVRVALLPADPGAPRPDPRRGRHRCAARRRARSQGRRRGSRHGPGPADGRSRTGGRRPETRSRAPGRARRGPGRGRRPRPASAAPARRPRSRARDRPGPSSGTWTVMSRVAASYSSPSGAPVCVTPDDAAGGIGRVAVEPGRSQRRMRGEQRVVVVSPERHATTGRDGLEVGRGGPASPSVGAPAVTLEPRVRVRHGARARRARGPALRRASPHRSGRPGAARRRRRPDGGGHRSGPGSPPRRAPGRSAP